jgi:uncharacterized protein with GYD domain
MPKYLWQVSYTVEGARGLAAEGGSGRRAAIQQMIESVGGKLEAIYFAFGDTDLVVIGELPDHVAAAALGVRTTAGGAARVRTTVLLTPEELDQAVHTDVEYRLPGE